MKESPIPARYLVHCIVHCIDDFDGNLQYNTLCGLDRDAVIIVRRRDDPEWPLVYTVKEFQRVQRELKLIEEVGYEELLIGDAETTKLVDEVSVCETCRDHPDLPMMLLGSLDSGEPPG